MKRQQAHLQPKKDGTVIATLNGNKTEYIPRKLHKIFKNMAVNRAKSEAIKEFAERLKEKMYSQVVRNLPQTSCVSECEQTLLLLQNGLPFHQVLLVD